MIILSLSQPLNHSLAPFFNKINCCHPLIVLLFIIIFRNPKHVDKCILTAERNIQYQICLMLFTSYCYENDIKVIKTAIYSCMDTGIIYNRERRCHGQ